MRQLGSPLTLSGQVRLTRTIFCIAAYITRWRLHPWSIPSIFTWKSYEVHDVRKLTDTTNHALTSQMTVPLQSSSVAENFTNAEITTSASDNVPDDYNMNANSITEAVLMEREAFLTNNEVVEINQHDVDASEDGTIMETSQPSVNMLKPDVNQTLYQCGPVTKSGCIDETVSSHLLSTSLDDKDFENDEVATRDKVSFTPRTTDDVPKNYNTGLQKIKKFRHFLKILIFYVF